MAYPRDKHKPNDKQKCVIYEYNFNLKRLMADRNISIYEAMNMIRKPDTKKETEWRREYPKAEEEIRAIRIEEEKRGAIRMKTRKGYRSYAEAVQRSDSSEEEQRKEEWRRKERKRIKGKKKRRQVEEHNRQRR